MRSELSSSLSVSKPCPGSIHRQYRTSLWFPDGNVILVAKGTYFKVHRGQLERHSEVFYDIFSLPQPPDSPQMDGCHLVELYDSPTDVYHLLKALYDGLYFKKPFADDFSVIAAVLRLSTKYVIEHLRERCCARLEVDWPNTLPGWDQRETKATDSEGRYAPRNIWPHPILVINMAREMGLDFLLPSAFYDLCRYAPSRTLSGVTTTVNGKSYTIKLSSSDLYLVLYGRECAQRAMAKFIEDDLCNRNQARDCHNLDLDGGQSCRESFYFVMLNTLRSVGGISCGRDGDPLYSFSQATEMLSSTDFSDGSQKSSLRICSPCRVEFMNSVADARDELWSKIPSWFGMTKFEQREDF